MRKRVQPVAIGCPRAALGAGVVLLGLIFGQPYAQALIARPVLTGAPNSLQARAALTSNGSSAQPQKRELRRRVKLARLAPAHPARANDSYLYDLSVKDVGEEPVIWIDEKRAQELQQQYQDSMREYDARARQGLASDPRSREQHLENVRSMARSVTNSVTRTATQRNLKQARRVVEKVGKVPSAIVGAAVVLTTGQPIRFRLAPDLNVIARSNAVDATGELNVTSNVVNTSISFRGRNEAPGQERFSLAVSRELPVWSLSSGLTYGSTSQCVAASLSKPLTPELALVLDQRHSVNGAVPAEGTFRLQYGLRF